MDFWASLEHKIFYKFEGDAPDYISKELRECSEIVSVLDDKMLSLNQAITLAKKRQEEERRAEGLQIGERKIESKRRFVS